MAKKRLKVRSRVRKLGSATVRDIAFDFAQKVHERFDQMVKASILFGSQAKHTSSSSSDIDIILIIDDAGVNWDLELISWYREELAKLIAASKYNKMLHINTVKLTSWWQDLLYGEPVVINILRYGEPLIDSGGFFTPLKALLLEGKIRSTPEAIYASLQRAPTHLARSKSSELSAVEGIYWTMIDSAQAALMTAGLAPPSPEHIPEMLKEAFVDKGMLEMKHVKAVEAIYNIHKAISHAEIIDIRGADIDSWQDAAQEFLSEMTDLISKLLESKK